MPPSWPAGSRPCDGPACGPVRPACRLPRLSRACLSGPAAGAHIPSLPCRPFQVHLGSGCKGIGRHCHERPIRAGYLRRKSEVGKAARMRPLWRRTSASRDAAGPPSPPSAARRLHGEPACNLHPTGAASLPSAAVTQSRHRAFGWSSGCPLPTCGTRRCGSAGRGCIGRTLCGTRLDWPRTLGNRKSIPLQPAPARRGPT